MHVTEGIPDLDDKPRVDLGVPGIGILAQPLIHVH